jgi:hypothetical protein
MESKLMQNTHHSELPQQSPHEQKTTMTHAIMNVSEQETNPAEKKRKKEIENSKKTRTRW